MTSTDIDRLEFPRRNVRLDTLVRLRWLSVIGQTVAVLGVYYGFEFDLPLIPCLVMIALPAALNIVLQLRFPATARIAPNHAALLLAFDIAQLTAVMYLTGGLENPFEFFFLGPVLISATALPRRTTALLCGFAIACSTLLAFWHEPLPWTDQGRPLLPEAYIFGVWLSMILAIFVIAVYAWQIAEEQRQLSDALTATELVLAREQHLSQLDGLAAAAAHALGTPLSTISVVARELEREIGPQSKHFDDIKLLREQTQKCRDILAKLNELSATGEPFGRLPLPTLLEEVVAPHRNFGIAIEVKLPGASDPPAGARNPAILYGLGNLLENAVDFAQARVEVAAHWTDEIVSVVISDDGPGFAPEIIKRIGEPYVRSRRRRRMYASDETGLGLGFFIAKTLLERSGATLNFVNRAFPERGAIVTVTWPRGRFEEVPPEPALENAAATA
jgi:two-component system sensor histidine kinase RegB